MNPAIIRVLLVEDSDDDIAIARRMLSKYRRVEFRIDDVSSAARCIERLDDRDYDILLIDHGLPDMTGIELLRLLGARTSAPPAIMLTGQGDERIATQAMGSGAYDYFPKDSITSDMLGHAIHQAFEKLRVERELFDEQMEGSERIIFALATAAEAKDPSTERHLQRMATYAGRLGRALDLDDRQLLLLRYGALLHDIGKIGVSETILAKPTPLNPEDWREMRQHPVIGERICQPLKLAAAICPIVRHHHERWDGKGYVDGLAGEDIPFLARVVSVVDAFDAMTSDRPYRAALSLDEALRRLRAGAGAEWDPSLVSVFAGLVEREGQQFLANISRPQAA